MQTDFVPNINETILFALNLTQIDRLYCVCFRDTHIWSLRNLTEFLSAQMQIFFILPNDCYRNWNGFVIIESFLYFNRLSSQSPKPIPTTAYKSPVESLQ